MRYHGASGQEDVLRAVELGPAGYFVAGFGLDVGASGYGAGFWGHGFVKLVGWLDEVTSFCLLACFNVGKDF